MDPVAAQDIADHWKYPPPYDFYDATADPEDYDEFVNPASWPDFFYKAVQSVDVLGFLTLSLDAGRGEMALGLRPDLTGRGLGLVDMEACIEQAKRDLPGEHQLKLSVATFNSRAIRVYEKAGFSVRRTYMQETNGGHYEFVEMALRAVQLNEGKSRWLPIR